MSYYKLINKLCEQGRSNPFPVNDSNKKKKIETFLGKKEKVYFKKILIIGTMHRI